MCSHILHIILKIFHIFHHPCPETNNIVNKNEAQLKLKLKILVYTYFLNDYRTTFIIDIDHSDDQTLYALNSELTRKYLKNRRENLNALKCPRPTISTLLHKFNFTCRAVDKPWHLLILIADLNLNYF